LNRNKIETKQFAFLRIYGAKFDSFQVKYEKIDTGIYHEN